jgi:hypothetical protein
MFPIANAAEDLILALLAVDGVPEIGVRLSFERDVRRLDAHERLHGPALGLAPLLGYQVDSVMRHIRRNRIASRFDCIGAVQIEFVRSLRSAKIARNQCYCDN